MPEKKSPSPAPAATTSMDLSEITKIVDLMAKNDLTLFHLERGGSTLKLQRGQDLGALTDLLARLPSQQPQVVYSAGAPMAAPAAAPQPAPAAAPASKASEPATSGPTINSPMVGTFYRSSAPGEKAFVSVGDHVEANSTVCIIEAMKVMNEIKAETSGTVARVLAEDGKPVQYGQPLFELK